MRKTSTTMRSIPALAVRQLGKVPMTGAECVRVYRLKYAAAKPVPKPTADNVAATIDELQKDLARP